MSHMDNTFGIEIECYLPEGTSAQAAAAAITSRGVECSAESYHHQVRGYWKIVTDGSLGDYTRGIEVVSPILSGEAGLAAIVKVMEALTDFGCTVSRQCGLHVHVGVGNAPISFFKNLWKLYSVYEGVIDAFMPPSRRKSTNQYCRTVTNAPIASIDRASSLDDLLNLFSGDMYQRRYHKLNYASYRRYQTVEFRQHSGTLDSSKATKWTVFCLRMVNAAMNGESVATGTTTVTPQYNLARPGTKTWLVGNLMMRPQGVSNREAVAATGWTSGGLVQVAESCGLRFVTERMGREVRYYARATSSSTTSVSVAATLDTLFEKLGCSEDEQAYFRTRTANLSGRVGWQA